MVDRPGRGDEDVVGSSIDKVGDEPAFDNPILAMACHHGDEALVGRALLDGVREFGEERVYTNSFTPCHVDAD
jgi:hypothetical protein